MYEYKKLEKVKKGLEVCQGQYSHHYCSKCPYEMDLPSCVRNLMRDAGDMLDAQKPRMMSHAEAIHNAFSFRQTPDSVKPVFVQFRNREYADEGMCPPWRGGVNQRELVERSGAYGVEYIFWTDRPTEKQMEETPWQ